MEKLKRFLKFIKKNHLEDVARENLRVSKELNLPLMKYFSFMPEETLITMSIKSGEEFIDSVLDDTYREKQKISLQQWQEDKLPGIPKGGVTLNDLILVYSATRTGYAKYLPEFTDNMREALEIMTEFEKIHLEAQEEAVQIFFKIQRETEEELNTYIQTVQLLVDNIKDYAVFMIDPDGKILTWNAGAEIIKGYTAQEAIGQHIAIFYTKDEIRKGEPEYNLKMAKENGRHETEGWRKRKDGSLFWADTILTTVYTKEGELKGIAKITRDITEKKETEKKIAILNNMLEEKIEALKGANDELEAFCYSVSHDLRAPLRAIHGFTKILSEDHVTQLSEDAKVQMGRIMFNATKMGQLIDDLLAFSRLGKRELQKEKLNMAKIVKTVIEDVKNDVPDFHAKIVVHPLASVIADPHLIEQVFTNLIGNAVKYSSPREKPLIEIGSKEENGDVIYYVKDNGVGFDMAHYDKLFGVFQRLHSAEEFEGTGVGLALVKRIVARHGGRVWAEAEVDKGATFSFSLKNTTH